MPHAAHFMPWRLRYIPMFSDINVKEITKLEITSPSDFQLYMCKGNH